MNEPHTADLGTRYRYRQEGAQFERERILQGLDAIEEQSHRTKTPLYQDTLFKLMRDLVEDLNPPRRFRDIGNGE